MKKLLIVQSRIQHYRIPLFDKLEKTLKKKYQIVVSGGSKDGIAFGGVQRSYIHGLSYNQFFQFHYWGGIIKKINELKPDIIITTASPRNLSLYLMLLYSYYTKTRIIGWSKINSKKKNTMKFYKKLFYNFFKEMIVYGNKSVKELKEIGYKGKFTVANNTIDTDLIENNEAKINKIIKDIVVKYKIKNKKIILFLGRLDREKRPNDLNIFEEILSKDKKNMLAFVGEGPEKVNLEKFKNNSKYSDQILVTGRVPNFFDYAWIKISNVYIVPGQVGLAIKQAMLLKTPVIIADEYGVDGEVVENELTGLRYKKGDKLDLINKYKKLEGSYQLRQYIIDNAYKLIKKNHTLSNMTKSIVSVL